ncbi:hypothetical protein DdX_05191 [Ditylenchus destructor]|uniref:Uncharacterized protein n=1 Tax=Ditylenchus destructor TaxID=166010 RepID=A0AAD4RAP4_9BILA|nr:hypothetical protein DdX_05191 [Ditylenchus destructor]
MNLSEFQPDQFLRNGIGEKIVKAIQCLQRNEKQPNDDENRDSPSTSCTYQSSFPDDSATTNAETKNNTPDDDTKDVLPNRTIDDDGFNPTTIIKSGILATALFYGFKIISDEAAQTFTNVLVDKLDRMSYQLSVLADRHRRGRPCSYPSPVHQVLNMHKLSLPELHKYYHDRFLRRCNRIEQNTSPKCEGIKRQENMTRDEEIMQKDVKAEEFDSQKDIQQEIYISRKRKASWTPSE